VSSFAADPDERHSASEQWGLDRTVAYLDHGSFGACPLSILDAQSRLRERMERQPAEFFSRELGPLLDAARQELVEFLGADADDLAFVPNATYGVNAVLRSLSFSPGDELLATHHGYAACRNALRYVAERTGAKLRIADIPFPIASPLQVVDSVMAAATDRTRLAVIDHVSSPTALIFPVREIVQALARRGIEVLVDGAHAPGMVPLDVPALGATYYVGNCHKWLCAPKGSAFLWVNRDRQREIHPLSISHGFASPREDRTRFLLEFDWTGTDDPTPWLCVPDALRFLKGLRPGGIPQLMASNRALAVQARNEICGALFINAPAPDAMIGAMVSVPVREARDDEYGGDFKTDPLHKALLTNYRINANVVAWPQWPKRLLRISAQAYNAPRQYTRLAEALRELRIGE
jgi:isopenicillin-N epimerase